MSKFLQTLVLGCIVAMLALPSNGFADEDPKPGLNETTFEGLEWRGIGPALMSGRIADIAIDPVDRSTWYIAVGSGGVWKTTNRGTTWTSVFDDQGAYSIGSVTVDPIITIRSGSGQARTSAGGTQVTVTESIEARMAARTGKTGV